MATLKEVEKRVLALEKRVKAIQKDLKTSPATIVDGPKPKASNKTGEENVGINVLAYAGILALIFSLAFLFNYSYDNNWFGAGWFNVILMLVIAHGIMYIGFKNWNHKFYHITRLLLVGGAALNFFTFLSMYWNDGIRAVLGVSMELTVFLTTLVVLEVAWAAAHFDSKFLLFQFYLFGIIASFIPGLSNLITLFYAFVVLLAGIFLTHQKGWNALNIPLMITTYSYFIIVATGIALRKYMISPAAVFIFLILYYILFHVAREISKDKTYDRTLYIINNAGFFLCSIVMLPANGLYPKAIINFYEAGLLVGVVANLFDGFFHKAHSKTAAWSSYLFFIFFMLSLVDKYFDTLVLALLSIILLIYGFRKGVKYLRIQGLILVNFSFLKLIFVDTNGLSAGIRIILFLVFAVIMIIGSIYYMKYSDGKRG